MGDLSPHFDRSEFRCHGFDIAGHPPHPTIVDVALVELLERIRSAVGRPIVIISGHRCAWWNRKVGGARRSQHLDGRASDLRTGVVAEDTARREGARGIGTSGAWAVHVDVRPGRRATWRY